ncbi:MAG: hypothetical protein NAG76_19600 [Candidatus Pristimantibacillus lignocellulolyticus]|uniref:Glycosyltransferase subfamily 4-like N-terminal domain-containing protein n=1 Tax=Candidatus Pristimantibacillus lignocellulolyticus TaxID=2994561 RepID=A0A9J6ZCZ6_9BACL|nr:MAG: hypothetical protein NAG76_19600 [Candidatus Pristimantibacillus lignocellulolyticus]
MKILYITSVPLEYSSSANMRNLALIRGFQQLGFEISTLSSIPEIESSYYDKTMVRTDFKDRHWIELGAVHTKFTSKKIESALDKLKAKLKVIAYKVYTRLSLYDSRARLAKRIPVSLANEEFDLIISSSDPKSSHLIAEQLITQYPNITKLWYQYWGDPFAIDVNKNTLFPTWIVEREERRILEKCHKSIYVSPITHVVMQEKYPELKKKMVFEPIPYNEQLFYKETNNSQYTLGYFGDYFSKDRTITPLINSLTDSDIKLHLIGNSDIEITNTHNINSMSRQSIDFIRKLEAEVDLLICVCNKKGTQIPGKIYHYSATNKPILLIVDGEYYTQLVNYFSQFERYYICENNVNDIRKTINEIMNLKQNFNPINYFSPQTIAKRLVNNSNS